MNTFSIREAVRFALSAVKRNVGFYILLSVLIFVVAFGAEMINEYRSVNESDVLSLVAHILLLVLNLILSIWAIRVGLDAAEAKKPSFSNFLPSWEVVWKFILSNALVALIVVVPAILFVGAIALLTFGSVVGLAALPTLGSLSPILVGLVGVLVLLLIFALIYLGTRFMFSTYYVVDQKLGPIESVRASWHSTHSFVWKLIGLMFVLSLINFVGMLAFFIGLLVTIPITLVATAYAYRQISQTAHSVPTPSGDVVEPVPTPTIEQ